MPNAETLNEKKAIVAGLTEKIKNASSGILVDYSGITVAQDTEMRRKLPAVKFKYLRRDIHAGLQRIVNLGWVDYPVANGDPNPVQEVIAVRFYHNLHSRRSCPRRHPRASA